MALVEATVCRKLEGMYGSRAAFLRKQRADDREVLIFALLDRPDACCFVWQDGGRVRTVLGEARENALPSDVPR